jgi:hypothetical protein
VLTKKISAPEMNKVLVEKLDIYRPVCGGGWITVSPWPGA